MLVSSTGKPPQSLYLYVELSRRRVCGCRRVPVNLGGYVASSPHEVPCTRACTCNIANFISSA
jgi:hypothetical protein